MSFNDSTQTGNGIADTAMLGALRDAGVNTEDAVLNALADESLKRAKGNVERARDAFVGRLSRRLLIQLMSREAVNYRAMQFLARRPDAPRLARKPAAEVGTQDPPLKTTQHPTPALRQRHNAPRVPMDVVRRVETAVRRSVLDTQDIDGVPLGRCSLGTVRTWHRKVPEPTKISAIGRLLDHLRHVPDFETVAAHLTPDDADRLFEKAKTDA